MLVTLGRTRQKLFEIYDRIAMGAIGHPGDIERLRMAAIELASTEGFTRSAADVSLRRLAYYSLSPVLKAAFEQVYGAPFLARLLFAEIGKTADEDLFLRVEYDGAILTSSGASSGDVSPQRFGALSGTLISTQLIEAYLQREHEASATLARALDTALNALTVGKLALTEAGVRELPDATAIADERARFLQHGGVEVALLERDSTRSIRYRSLGANEIAAVIKT